MNIKKKEQQFDLTRNDKFYQLTIPKHSFIRDCVFYEIHLKDLVKNQTYVHEFRYKELKQYHESLSQLKLELPEFPKTHFWRKTNKHPEMIKERQFLLQKYFAIIVNDPFTRGYREVKKFIKICKLGKRGRRCFSNKKAKRVLSTTKSKSLSHQNSEINISFTVKK